MNKPVTQAQQKRKVHEKKNQKVPSALYSVQVNLDNIRFKTPLGRDREPHGLDFTIPSAQVSKIVPIEKQKWQQMKDDTERRGSDLGEQVYQSGHPLFCGVLN